MDALLLMELLVLMMMLVLLMKLVLRLPCRKRDRWRLTMACH